MRKIEYRYIRKIKRRRIIKGERLDSNTNILKVKFLISVKVR